MNRRGILKSAIGLAVLGSTLGAASGLAVAKGDSNHVIHISAEQLAKQEYYAVVREIVTGKTLAQRATAGAGEVQFTHLNQHYRITTAAEMWKGEQPSVRVRVYGSGSPEPLSNSVIPLETGGFLQLRKFGFEIRVTPQVY